MEKHSTITIAGHHIGVTTGNEGCTGPAVVFLHGILGSERFWAPLLPEAVSNKVRWFAVSLPGHFPSRFPADVQGADLTADCLTDVLHELIHRLVGAEPVGLVGWSTGGCLALCLAARWPVQVRSVLSIAGFARPLAWALGRLQKLARGGTLAQGMFRQALRTMTASNWLYRQSYSLAAASAGPLMRSETARDVLREVRRDAAQQDGEAMRLLCANIRGWDVMDRLRTIRAPVIIAGGDRDPIIPYSHTLDLAEAIPTARLVSFAGMGHTFFAEHLHEFHACLQAWLYEMALREAA